MQVRLASGAERSVVWPPDAPDHRPDVCVPVRHLGEELGRIELRLLPGGALSRESQDLLADLAGQAGVALRNVRLTVELRARLHELEQGNAALAASRSRLVTASTGERQRLERQIADRVQPHLVALSAGLPGVERLLSVPEQAGRALEPLVEEASTALEALREVAHGVYPPLLVDHGLLPAVESVARGARVPVRVAVDDPAEVLSGDRRLRYPAATEAAAYFCLLDVLSGAAPEADVDVLLRAEPERLEVTVAGAEPASEAVAAAQDRAGARGGVVRVEPGPRPAVVIALPAQAGSDVRETLARVTAGYPPAAEPSRSSSTSGPEAALRHEGSGAGRRDLCRVVLQVVGRQQQDGDVRRRVLDPSGRRQTVHAGQDDVHQDQVGLQRRDRAQQPPRRTRPHPRPRTRASPRRPRSPRAGRAPGRPRPGLAPPRRHLRCS